MIGRFLSSICTVEGEGEPEVKVFCGEKPKCSIVFNECVTGTPEEICRYENNVYICLALWVKFSADNVLKYFSHFSQETGFDVPCKLSPSGKFFQ